MRRRATPQSCRMRRSLLVVALSAAAATATTTPPASNWKLPAIDWSATPQIGPTITHGAGAYAVRAIDSVFWPADGRVYAYCDLVLFSNPKCPSSFGSEIGVFSADSYGSEWMYEGIAAHKNQSIADAGGLATPAAMVVNGSAVMLFFAYEGLPVGAGERGIGLARAAHPLGPFTRLPPAAVAPKGWHRPLGPGGIFDDPEVMHYGGRYHLFHSRKHVRSNDTSCDKDGRDVGTGNGVQNCCLLAGEDPESASANHCVEWRTSDDAISWKRMGVVHSPGVTPGANKTIDPEMSETMSIRIYGETVVMITDGHGMSAYVTEAKNLLGDSADFKWSAATPTPKINDYAGLSKTGKYVGVTLRVMPETGDPDSAHPTHVMLGWRPPKNSTSVAPGQVDKPGCGGGMTFAVYPLLKLDDEAAAAAAAAAGATAWRRCAVEDYGAIAETGAAAADRGDDSAAIFAALVACGGERGGEVVLRGPGIYDAKPMNLTSNQVLHVAAGAVLQAPTPAAGECVSSETPCPYAIVQSFPSYTGSRDYGEPCRLGPFIGAYKARNISITGGGTIDGAGAFFWHQMRKMTIERPRLVEPMFVTDLRIGPIHLRQSAFWNLHPIYSERVHIHDISIVATPEAALGAGAGGETTGATPNTDGIDPDSCKDVLIENYYYDAGDDAIAVKSGWNYAGYHMNHSSENILARNCSSNGRGGYTIGSEMSGGIRNVTFEDSTSTGESGIRISSQPGRGGYVTDVTVRRVAFHWTSTAGKSFLFHINQQRICKPGCTGGPKCGFACDNKNASLATPFSNFRFEDISVRAPADFKLGDFTGGAIPIRGVILRNITISGPQVSKPGHAITCVNVSGTSSAVSPPGAVCKELQGAASSTEERAAQETTIASIATVNAAESVYDWETQHCATGRPLAPCHPKPCRATPYRRDVPDAPAMAWRDPVSNLTFVAPGDSRGTWPSVGRGLDAVKHDCSQMIFNYSGPTGFLQAPSKFSSHEWLYAPYVVAPKPGSGKNATLYMLVHNEFHGWEHAPQLCNATSMVRGRCWYNSVSMSVSHDGGRHIEHIAPPPHHVIAAAATEYTPNNGAFGVFSPSQIVIYKGWLYSFPRFATQAHPQGTAGSGITIMRIREKDLDDPKAWRFWTGGAGDSAFTGKFTDPYTQPGGAAPAAIPFGNITVGNITHSPMPGQAVPRYLPEKDMFVMTGYANVPSGHGPAGHFGYSTAKQPWGPWAAMRPIIGVDVNPTKDAGGAGGPRGLYPSLLDPSSPALNYDTIEGDTAYVYWVQGRNKTVVGAPDMARDLWRQKVKLTFK